MVVVELKSTDSPEFKAKIGEAFPRARRLTSCGLGVLWVRPPCRPHLSFRARTRWQALAASHTSERIVAVSLRRRSPPASGRRGKRPSQSRSRGSDARVADNSVKNSARALFEVGWMAGANTGENTEQVGCWLGAGRIFRSDGPR